jgi:ElaB/YqjD/DUF883 family membrane-anchored ribosome-binding protein
MITKETNYMEAVEAAKSRVQEKLETAQRKAAESAKAAMEAVEAAKFRVGGRFQTAQRKATETAKAAAETTGRYIRENPGRTILVVALAACTFGYLLGTKRE